MTFPYPNFPDSLSERPRVFLDYWHSRRGAKIMPDRTEIDPADITALLPHVVIHELVSPELIRLRLMGTAVVEDYGQDTTGKNYLSFVEPARRAKASEAIFNIPNHPAGMTVKLRSISKDGKAFARETMALPVSDLKSDRKLVYFVSQRLDDSFDFNRERDELQVQTISNRKFFDIGAGVPDFQD